jgi:ADP-heptose:LPS heptosyltransferase
LVKFLVIRFSSIGDIVLTSPVVRNLKEQVPNSEVHFLTKPTFASIAENNPYIDKVHTLKEDWNDMMGEIKNENFDHIIDLHNNLRTKRIKSALSIPAFTFDKLNIKKWLLVNLKVNKLPNIHIVDRYMETLSVFDVKNDQKGLDYFIPDQDKYNCNDFTNSNGFIALVLGATYFTKQIPTEIIEELITSSPHTFILLGGPDDVNKAETIETKLKNAKNLVNLCGKINLDQSASVIEQAQLVISSDTGLMHIAAAFNKPIISLWGNTVPEFGMAPYLPNELSIIIENKNLRCRPCSKIGYNKCPKKHFDCMNKLDVSTIKNHIDAIYAQ